MMTGRMFWTMGCVASVMLAACAEKKAAEQVADTTTAGTGTAAIPAMPSAPIEWKSTREYDLTGDGRPERFTAVARGKRYDSLDVVLQIRSATDSLLYEDKWNSLLYFVYESQAGKADSTIERIVRGHLDRLLRDSAFVTVPTRDFAARIDTPSVAYDLGERADKKISAAYRDSIIADINPRTRFRYFAGGEVTHIMAWSDRLGRFVKTFLCC